MFSSLNRVHETASETCKRTIIIMRYRHTLTTSIGVVIACEVDAQMPPAKKYLQEPCPEIDISSPNPNNMRAVITTKRSLSVVDTSTFGNKSNSLELLFRLVKRASDLLGQETPLFLMPMERTSVKTGRLGVEKRGDRTDGDDEKADTRGKQARTMIRRAPKCCSLADECCLLLGELRATAVR